MNGRVGVAAVAILCSVAAARAYPQPRVIVRDPGPGAPGRVLQIALAAPHILLTPSGDTAVLRRDSIFRRTVIALGRHVTVDGAVAGDVIVVAGDLVLHPGARIDGRAIAIGGGVYNSTLAIVGGGRTAYREETFDITPLDGGYALDYRLLSQRTAQRLSLPFLYGIRVPTYDRIDGASLRFGPLVTLDTGDIEIEPTVTYRSHIGKFDPAVRATAQRGRRTRFEAFGGRGTFSNDRWIHGDLINSVNALFAGTDSRNYYRADRAEATGHRLWELKTGQIEPFIGAQWERSWSVGSPTLSTSVPWSFFGRHAVHGMARPNPPVTGGRITSLLGGLRADWQAGGVAAKGTVGVEGALEAPASGHFVQTTLDGGVSFPTFHTQSFRLEAHAVFTGGTDTPSQRYAYLGGAGTLPTFDLLEFGGDQLLFIDSRYNIPLTKPRLPLVGAPVFTIRHMFGGAGVGSLPSLEQNLALRLTLGLIRVEFVVDPASGESRTGVALAFSR